jgi:ribosomal protein S3
MTDNNKQFNNPLPIVQIHKRKSTCSDFNKNESIKRQKMLNNNTNKIDKIELRLLISIKEASTMIGRSGSNIKMLKQMHNNIRIHVADCNGPERLLIISGDTKTTYNTIESIVKLLEKYHSNELRLLIHKSQAGCLIGRGGDQIKDLRIKHNLDMKVYAECAPKSTERICKMIGKSSDILACLKQVIDLLKFAPSKGIICPYDPNNYNEFTSSEYGGIVSDKQKSINQIDKFNNRQNTTTYQVTIPNYLVGFIIGPKGQSIQNIRNQSGASITINTSTTTTITDLNDRIITIIGLPEQIHNALYMLQVTVKQSGLWKNN